MGGVAFEVVGMNLILEAEPIASVEQCDTRVISLLLVYFTSRESSLEKKRRLRNSLLHMYYIMYYCMATRKDNTIFDDFASSSAQVPGTFRTPSAKRLTMDLHKTP